MRSSIVRPERQQFFRSGPPHQSGGLQSKIMERWKPQLQERWQRLPILPERVPAEPESSFSTKQREELRTDYVEKFVQIKEVKNILVNQIACMGIVHINSLSKVAGRLQHHISNWKLVTKDQWVWSAVEGYHIDLISEPLQIKLPTPPTFNQDQFALIQQEVKELVNKGAVSEVLNPQAQMGFYSNLFLVPKKDGGQRPVINLKALNEFVQMQHFKMEGIHTLKELVRPGDWLAKLDLKDAYFTIPIHQNHRKFLRFLFQEKTYEFNCLPFGLSSAPWVFTKTLKPVSALLRQLGVRMIVYIDDILLLADSRELLEDQVSGLVYLLECLGFLINMKKSLLQPSQSIEFLGIMVDTLTMELKLPGEKLKKIRAEAGRCLREESITARALSRLLGKMNAATQVIPPAPLFYRHLQMSLSQALDFSSQNYETNIMLSRDCKEELSWWIANMRKWNGKTLLQKEIDLTIESDASLTGWGAVCSYQRTGGPWSQMEKMMHINCLELLAATLAVQTFAKNSNRISLLLLLDNTTAVAYINNLGGTISKQLVGLAKDLWMWCLERNIHITAQHLPGKLNYLADTESRVMMDRSDWRLNPITFQKIDRLFGPLEVDLFASRLTTQLQTFFSWRPDPYAMASDSFLQDWTTRKGYANPPWCMIGRTLSQVKSQLAQIVLVTPVWKSQPWYPVLLNMVIDYPRLILDNPVVVNQHFPGMFPQLAIWLISGRDIPVKNFQRMLQH